MACGHVHDLKQIDAQGGPISKLPPVLLIWGPKIDHQSFQSSLLQAEWDAEDVFKFRSACAVVLEAHVPNQDVNTTKRNKNQEWLNNLLESSIFVETQ